MKDVLFDLPVRRTQKDYSQSFKRQVVREVELVSYHTIEKDPNWGIEMKFDKQYTPTTKGRITLYLCDELVDMNKKITVTVNGRKAFKAG